MYSNFIQFICWMSAACTERYLTYFDTFFFFHFRVLISIGFFFFVRYFVDVKMATTNNISVISQNEPSMNKRYRNQLAAVLYVCVCVCMCQNRKLEIMTVFVHFKLFVTSWIAMFKGLFIIHFAFAALLYLISTIINRFIIKTDLHFTNHFIERKKKKKQIKINLNN